jgi:hypothetical protein
LIKLYPTPFKSQWSKGFAAFLRGVRRSLAKDNLIRNLKTLMGVIPLTILVWVVAEQHEQVQSTTSVRIAVQSTDPAHRAVTLLNPVDGTLQVTLQGSQVGIDRVRALLRQTLVSDPLEIDVGTSLPPGAHQPLVALDQIAANRVFSSEGVTVTACAPETLLLQVDALEDQVATVTAPPDTPGLIQAVFHPAVVTMRGPISLLTGMSHRGPLTAVADLSNEPALKMPGQHNRQPVPLIVPEDITLVPGTVLADLTVGQSDEDLSVSPVPVKVLAPKWLTDNYKFDYKEVLPAPVVLTGPPQSMALIDPHAPKLVAVVELDNSDAGHQETKTIRFEDAGLPEGVHVKTDTPAPTIDIGVDPR